MPSGKNVFQLALSEGRKMLPEGECRKILSEFGIKMPMAGLAKSGDEAAKLAARIGYPVVMKIMSQDIVHKTDAGCVALGLKSENDVRSAFADIMVNAKRAKAKKIQGVLVQKQVKGQELVAGVSLDPQFGHVIMFGLGGIFIEALDDVSFRLVPIEQMDAFDMLGELKSGKLLDGSRGSKPVNRKVLADMLLKVSDMVVKYPQISELDINPLFVEGKNIIAGDVRIIFG